jgi:hypothetical protein
VERETGYGIPDTGRPETEEQHRTSNIELRTPNSERGATNRTTKTPRTPRTEDRPSTSPSTLLGAVSLSNGSGRMSLSNAEKRKRLSTEHRRPDDRSGS